MFGKVGSFGNANSGQGVLMTLKERFVTVREAAEILGVSPNTLRNWGRDGRVVEYRHPLNNYRLFKVVDLQRLKKALHSPKRQPRKPR